MPSNNCRVKAGPFSHTIRDGTPNCAIIFAMKSSAHVAAVTSATGVTSTQRKNSSYRPKYNENHRYLVVVPVSLCTILEIVRKVLDFDVHEVCCVA